MSEVENNVSPPAQEKWLQRGFVLAMLLACAVSLSPNNVDPDLWGHYRYAEDWLADGHLAQTATHTYTAVGHPWINHENLSELAIAFGYRAFGARGLLVLKCLLGLVILAAMLLAARRRKVSLPVAFAFLVLVAYAIAYFWAVRPQLASYTLFALMIVLLDRAFRDWQTDSKVETRWLYLVPVLIAVWTNSHGGFVAGLAIFIAYLGCRSLEALRRDGRRSWPLLGQFAAVSAMAGLATLATPYGTSLLAWIGESLRHPRPEILEWAAPSSKHAFFVPLILVIGVTIASWLVSKKRRDWTHIGLIGVCIWQALSHSRHMPFLVILTGFWVPVHLESLIARVRDSQDSHESPPMGRTGRMVVGGGLLLAIGLLVAKLDTRLSEFPVDRNEYPIAAIQYMTDQQIEGKLVVAFNWAQYALCALVPEVEVAFDGRFRTCYPQKVIDMHFDFLLGDIPGRRYRQAESGPVDGHRMLDFQEPDLVLTDRRFPHSLKIMDERDDFVVLYQDSIAQLWGRKSRYDDPKSPHYIGGLERNISDMEHQGSVAWPALPRPRNADRKTATHPRESDSPLRTSISNSNLERQS